MPIAAAIALSIFVLGVLIVVVLTAWRLLTNLRDLAASVSSMSRQLGPALEALNSRAAEASTRAAHLEQTVAELEAPFDEVQRRPRGRRRGARRPPRGPNRSTGRGVD